MLALWQHLLTFVLAIAGVLVVLGVILWIIYLIVRPDQRRERSILRALSDEEARTIQGIYHALGSTFEKRLPPFRITAIAERLIEAGLLSSYLAPEEPRQGNPVRYYRITEEGLTALGRKRPKDEA